MLNDKTLQTIGWLASIAAVMMYVSYIDQIMLNMAGQKGSVIQALATVINCSLWTVYGAGRPHKDWPIVIANLPGIVLGLLAFITAL
jgi:uncharacterized protein with PQ loop repeat